MDWKRRNLQYAITLSVSVASLTVGVVSTWASPVLPKLKSNQTDFTISDLQISWMLAMNAPGFMTGSLATRFLADYTGRRTALLLSSIPYTVGATLILTCKKEWIFFITKFLWGFATGIVGNTIPIYLAEVSDREIRGSLSLFTSIMLSLGGVLTMTVGPFLTFRMLNILVLILPIVYTSLCWWIPESPYYLLKCGKWDSARVEMGRLKGSQDNVKLDEDLKTIQENMESEIERSSSVWELVSNVKYRRAVVIAAVLKFVQVMSGSGVIRDYFGMIMLEGRVNLDLSTLFIIFGVVKFVVGVISTLLVDFLGRRPLLITSLSSASCILLILGLYFLFLERSIIDKEQLRFIGWLPFVGIVLSNVISALTNSIVFVIPSELFPMNVKAVAITSLNISSSCLSFINTLSYKWIKDLSGLYGVFWTFSAVTLVGAVFVILCLPETKGRSLEEIQTILKGGKIADSNSKVELKILVKEKLTARKSVNEDSV